MRKSALTVAVAVVFGLAACAPARHQPPGPEADLLAIQRKLSESEEKIDQLTQRVTMIQILVDSHQRTLQDLEDGATAGEVNADMHPASPVPETKTAPLISHASPTVSEIEKSAPVSENAPPEPSPEPGQVETAQRPETGERLAVTEPPPPYQEAMEKAAPVSENAPPEPSPEPGQVETVQRPETGEGLAVPEPPPPYQEAMEKAAPVSENAPPEPSPEPGQVETAQRPETEESLTVPEPNPLYQEAMEVFRGGDYEAAAGLFESFARQFPKDDLADNALYWSGECRYTRKDYAGAIQQFRQVIEEYPSGGKVPDTLLKIGFSYLSLGDKESAIVYLKKVVAQYPFSTAGAKAEERLKRLRK